MWSMKELLSLTEHLSSPPVFSMVRVARSVVFCVMFCISLFVLLSIVLSVLRFTASDYPIDIFKPFLLQLLMSFVECSLVVSWNAHLSSLSIISCFPAILLAIGPPSIYIILYLLKCSGLLLLKSSQLTLNNYQSNIRYVNGMRSMKWIIHLSSHPIFSRVVLLDL